MSKTNKHIHMQWQNISAWLSTEFRRKYQAERLKWNQCSAMTWFWCTPLAFLSHPTSSGFYFIPGRPTSWYIHIFTSLLYISLSLPRYWLTPIIYVASGTETHTLTRPSHQSLSPHISFPFFCVCYIYSYIYISLSAAKDFKYCITTSLWLSSDRYI